jgi:hypothetical protein
MSTGIGAGKPVSTLPVRDTEQPPQAFSSHRPEQGLVLPAVEPAPAAPTVADIPFNLAAARQAAYGEPVSRSRRSRILMLLLMCLIAFALFFVVGYFAGHWFLP